MTSVAPKFLGDRPGTAKTSRARSPCNLESVLAGGIRYGGIRPDACCQRQPDFLVQALPEDLLVRLYRTAGARSIVTIVVCCRDLYATVAGTTAELLHELHHLGRRHAGVATLPRLRQLHLLEQMATLSTSAMTVFHCPVLFKTYSGTTSATPPKACRPVSAPLSARPSRGRHPVSARPMSGARQCVARRSPPDMEEEVLQLSPRSYLPDPLVQMVSVACGRHHMMLLDNRGGAWAMGDARAGGVALEGADLKSPVLVTALGSVRLQKLACGNGHTIAMATNGDVFSWGRVLTRPCVGATQADGELDSSGEWLLPNVADLRAGEAVDVAAGEAHVAVASITGDVYTWGHNHHGQCAQPPYGTAGNACADSCLEVPHRVGGALDAVVARRVACGQYHTAVLSAEGLVYTFGAGFSGQLGRPAQCDVPEWQPWRVAIELALHGSSAVVPLPTGDDAPPAPAVQVACGSEHTICLTDTGHVIAFGSGEYGQLGLGGVRSHRTPVLLRTLRGSVHEVVAGAQWTLLRAQGGKVYLAGRVDSDPEDKRLLRVIVPSQ